MLAVPGFGQVQGDVAAAVPGGAGGDVDEVATDGGAAGLAAVGEAGQEFDGTQQIAGDGGAGQPGGIGREKRDGRWASGPSFQSAKTCSTIAWSRCCSLRLDQLERRIGEHGVVAPGREQLILPRRLVLVADPADDQPGGDGLAFLLGERGIGHLGDLGVGHPAAGLVIPDRTRVPDRRPGFFRDSGDLGVYVHRDREPGTSRRTAQALARSNAIAINDLFSAHSLTASDLMSQRIYKVSSRVRNWKLQTLPSSQLRGHLSR